MCDSNRLLKQRLRIFEPHRKMGTILLHLREEAFPTKTGPREILPLNDAAKIGDSVFHRLDTAIAARVQRQLGSVSQVSGLGGGHAVIHLEGDPLVRVLRTTVAAQIVLARGEKSGWSFEGGPVVERSLPKVRGRAAERLYAATTLQAYSRGGGGGEQRGIECLPRQGGRGKRQWRLRRALGCGEGCPDPGLS